MKPVPCFGWKFINIDRLLVHCSFPPNLYCPSFPDGSDCSFPKHILAEAFEDKETNSLISGDAAEFATVESGAGREADPIFADAQTEKTVLTASDKDAKATIRLAVDGTTAASAAGACYLTAEEGTDTTIIETFTKKSAQAGSLAYRTMIQAKKDSRVRLVQVFMQDEEQTLLNDIGCVCSCTLKICTDSVIEITFSEKDLKDIELCIFIADTTDFI